MPRPKGSKNKTKTTEKTTVISTIDYTELIEEKSNEKTQSGPDSSGTDEKTLICPDYFPNPP